MQHHYFSVRTKFLGAFAVLAFTFLLLPKAAQATTYYVDATSGSNSNSGTATDQAWQTISKINSSTFSAGDSILFKRGETWREAMDFPSSGSSGNPITIGAYGSGTKPTIYGSSLLSSTWTNTTGTIYKIALTTEPVIVLNGTTNLTESDGNFATLSSGQWDWASNELFVNIGTNPTGGNIEASQRNYAIEVDAKSHLTVENFIIRNCSESGVILYNGSTGFTANEVETYSCGNEGFKQLDTTSGTYSNIIANTHLDDGFSLHDSATATITTGTFNGNVSGIQNIGSSTMTASGLSMANNTSHGLNLLSTTATATVSDSTFTSNVSNLLFQNGTDATLSNITVSGGTFGLRSTSTAQISADLITISGATSNAIAVGGAGGAAITRAKISSSGDHAIDVTASGAVLTLSNSILYNNTTASKFALVFRAATSGTVKNTVFYNNTHGLDLIGTTSSATVHNSIFNAQGNAITFQSGALASQITLSNNDFFGNTANFSGATPTNTNGLAISPGFTNASGGIFTLLHTSGLINAGISTGLTADYAGNTVPQGSAPDVGAYEFLVASAPSSLAQYEADGTTTVEVGGSVAANSVTLKFTMSVGNASDSLTPQVEIRETGTDFSNSVTHAGEAVSYTGSAVTGTVVVENLDLGKTYHWQARVSNVAGQSSWASFGDNNETDTDFKTDSSTPSNPSLVSPTGFTTNRKPILIFKKSADSGSGIASYSVRLDGDTSKSYSITDIPAAGDGSASYVWKDEDDVKIEFLNEDDTDESNDEIRVTFKALQSSPLGEGTHTWDVTAYDHAANTISETANFYHDTTAPAISNLAVATVGPVSPGVSYTLPAVNRRPSFSGTALDKYEGSAGKVASGPKTLTLHLQRLNDGQIATSPNAQYTPYLSHNFALSKIIDVAGDRKYERFLVTTPTALVDGYYRVEWSLTDVMGNTYKHPAFYLSLTSPQPSASLPQLVSIAGGGAVGIYGGDVEEETPGVGIEETDADVEEDPVAAQPEGYALKITFVDNQRQPIKGARITIHSKVQQTMTDENGVARFSNVEPGEHRVLIAYNDFEGEERIRVSGENKDIDLTIQVKEPAPFSSPMEMVTLVGMGLAIVGLIVLVYKIKRRKPVLQ